jgi:hypothetical protein
MEFLDLFEEEMAVGRGPLFAVALLVVFESVGNGSLLNCAS